MPGYLLFRILLFIPTVLGILLISFFLSRQVPGDPVTQLMGEQLDNPQLTGNPFEYYREYDRAADKINRDMPSFYFSLAPADLPTSYFSEPHPRIQSWIRSLAANRGSAEGVDKFIAAYDDAGLNCWDALDDEDRNRYLNLQEQSDISLMIDRLKAMDHSCPTLDGVTGALEKLPDRQEFVVAPRLHWWGTENAFHRWISDLLVLDFGISLRDGRPATGRLLDALSWTLWMNLLAIIALLGIGLPLGVWLAVSSGKKRTDAVSSILYAGYAIPSFWLATMLLIFFSTTDWGRSLGGWMLRSPLLMTQDVSLLNRLRVLILPAISIVVPSMAFVARQMEQSVSRELGKTYVTTARAKGISRRRMIWNHVVPNALFPVITWLATLIPALLAGSVVIEVIFNIPGMGRLLWDSIFGRDWPVVFAVLVLTSFLALFGQWSADVLYAYLDPRVDYNQKNTDYAGQ